MRRDRSSDTTTLAAYALNAGEASSRGGELALEQPSVFVDIEDLAAMVRGHRSSGAWALATGEIGESGVAGQKVTMTGRHGG
jgi:hypothetical protein